MAFHKLILATTVACALSVAPASLLALGSGDDAGSGTSEKPTCKRGYIYSDKKKRCVRKTSRHLDRSDLLHHAWATAYAGDFRQARALFESLADRPDAEVYNGLGYSNRKLGAIAVGIGYYHKALALEPDYVLARSYLGEAYANAGKIALARNQLAEIGRRCGKQCKEYVYLLRAIEVGVPNDW